MTIEKIVDYVLHTPHNTNKAILIAMLEQLIRDNGGSTPSEPILYEGGIETTGGLNIKADFIYDGGMET